jgi:hypothetical protein
MQFAGYESPRFAVEQALATGDLSPLVRVYQRAVRQREVGQMRRVIAGSAALRVDVNRQLKDLGQAILQHVRWFGFGPEVHIIAHEEGLERFDDEISRVVRELRSGVAWGYYSEGRVFMLEFPLDDVVPGENTRSALAFWSAFYADPMETLNRTRAWWGPPGWFRWATWQEVPLWWWTEWYERYYREYRRRYGVREDGHSIAMAWSTLSSLTLLTHSVRESGEALERIVTNMVEWLHDGPWRDFGSVGSVRPDPFGVLASNLLVFGLGIGGEELDRRLLEMAAEREIYANEVRPFPRFVASWTGSS